MADARIPPALADALARAHYMYVTTYSRDGKPGTVPTWLWPHEGEVYFTTRRDSLKANQASDSEAKSVSIWPASAMSASEPATMPPMISANMKPPVSSAARPRRRSLLVAASPWA